MSQGIKRSLSGYLSHIQGRFSSVNHWKTRCVIGNLNTGSKYELD